MQLTITSYFHLVGHMFCRLINRNFLPCHVRYIKEGSTVTVFGVVQRHENVLMIVPPRTSISTGCLWSKLGFPKTVDGLIISCEQEFKNDGIPLQCTSYHVMVQTYTQCSLCIRTQSLDQCYDMTLELLEKQSLYQHH